MKLVVVLVLAVAIVNVDNYMIKIGNILINPDSIDTVLKDKDAIQIIYKNGVVKNFFENTIGIPYTQFIDELLKLSEKKDDKKAPKYILKERRSCGFERRFTLPNDVDTESIKANFKNGILSITLGKKAIATPKQIAIEAC